MTPAVMRRSSGGFTCNLKRSGYHLPQHTTLTASAEGGASQAMYINDGRSRSESLPLLLPSGTFVVVVPSWPAAADSDENDGRSTHPSRHSVEGGHAPDSGTSRINTLHSIYSSFTLNSALNFVGF